MPLNSGINIVLFENDQDLCNVNLTKNLFFRLPVSKQCIKSHNPNISAQQTNHPCVRLHAILYIFT